MNRDQAWKEYLKLREQGSSLDAQGNALHDHAVALWKRDDALYAQANALWSSAIAPLTIKEWKFWNHCILSNGEEYRP